MAKIVPHLWFDKEAGEAVDFYTSLFEDSEVTSTQKIEGTPSGDHVHSYEFTLADQAFMAINGGPHFTFNPSISLVVMEDTKEAIYTLWESFIEDGEELMPLQEYPFSELYGWVADKYDLNWQLFYSETAGDEQKITPNLLFSGQMNGKAEEAINFYTEIFANGQIEEVAKYQADEANDPKAEVAFASFQLLNTQLQAMDNANKVDYTFNEAVSLMIYCTSQSEIDYYWEKLSADPEAEQCGWLKDKYGVSWQVVPSKLNKLLRTGTQDQINAVTQRFLKMKKLDMDTLETAWYSEQ